MGAPRYPYVHVDVPPEAAEDAANVLFEHGAEGIEERDASTLIPGTAGRVTLVASFGSEADAETTVSRIDPLWSPRVEYVVGDAWRDEWKKYFHAFTICPGVVIAPPWESYSAETEEAVISLEPGRAFGTGLHETTALVAESIYRYRSEVTGVDALDVGCGSGILALIALTLGASRAHGLDIDTDSIAIARENADRNALTARATFEVGNAAGFHRTFSTVMANIEAGVLIALAPVLERIVLPDGLLVLSGLLATQADDVRRSFPRFAHLATPAKGDWIALVLRAPRASSFAE